MALVNARASLVADLMVSVRPYLNCRVAALSYVAVSLPYSLRDEAACENVAYVVISAMSVV